MLCRQIPPYDNNQPTDQKQAKNSLPNKKKHNQQNKKRLTIQLERKQEHAKNMLEEFRESGQQVGTLNGTCVLLVSPPLKVFPLIQRKEEHSTVLPDLKTCFLTPASERVGNQKLYVSASSFAMDSCCRRGCYRCCCCCFRCCRCYPRLCERISCVCSGVDEASLRSPPVAAPPAALLP